MAKSDIRMPAVAGKFYPAGEKKLREEIASFVKGAAQKTNAIACVLPHAGYMYSGAVAGATVASLEVKEKIILLGPNHTGYGVPFSIMTEGVWQTPLGKLKIDSDFAAKLLQRSEILEEDSEAHLDEHCLEVELPFLQYFKNDFEFVPIVIASQAIVNLKKLGEEIASQIIESGISCKTLIITSSDMTHYEPQADAETKDRAAIEAMLELNEDKLANRVTSMNISMCGYAPVVSAIVAAKILGAKKARLIKYQTSGDTTGDTESVVGYAGVIIE
ncbi:MAG: AmmeMemoRadiSam system protein B [Candidatus Omnitrophica bacterium]|nr:AmmeMemoRadiSam system protein B [Candidatus Omnitrophota bacterium]